MYYSVYRPNLRQKSDADILRDAKLEAMGMPPQDDLPRRSNHERTQMATDEMVCLMEYRILLPLTIAAGYGTFQEEDAKVVGRTNRRAISDCIYSHRCILGW
jgi:hypothetical protein